MIMKNLFIALTLIFLLSSACYAEEEILLEKNPLVPDESVLEEDDLVIETEVEKVEIPDISKPQELGSPILLGELKQVRDDLFKLQIDNTRVPAVLLKDYTTHKFEKGSVESVHTWVGLKFNLQEDIPEKGDNDTLFKTSLINTFIDGKFRGGKESFRIMLDPTPQHHHSTIQTLFQDLYIDSRRIPHHRILIGHTRPSVGYEGSNSSYTLPFAARSQIARNFGTVRKLGARVMGNYSLVDYDFGGYSSGTYFTNFFPGAEFDGFVNLKPLGKTDGKYGILKVGGGIAAGKRHSTNFEVYSTYAGYEYKNFRIKAEYANADGSNGLSGLTNKKRQGWSVTLYYLINKKLEAVARYDEFDPDKNIKHNNRREYSAGLSWYIKGQALKVILNYVFCQNQGAKDSHRIILGTQIAL